MEMDVPEAQKRKKSKERGEEQGRRKRRQTQKMKRLIWRGRDALRTNGGIPSPIQLIKRRFLSDPRKVDASWLG